MLFFPFCTHSPAAGLDCSEVTMSMPMGADEKMKIIDDAIEKKIMIADGHPLTPVTAAEDMRVYDCVFSLCSLKPPHDYASVLYDKCLSCARSRIPKYAKVLETLTYVDGIPLLREITRIWSEYEAFTKSVSRPFQYLDRYYVRFRMLPLTNDAPKQYFKDMVFPVLYGKLQEAIISLVIQEREGKPVDQELLKAAIDFFMKVGGIGYPNYYEKLMQEMEARLDLVEKFNCFGLEDQNMSATVAMSSD